MWTSALSRAVTCSGRTVVCGAVPALARRASARAWKMWPKGEVYTLYLIGRKYRSMLREAR